MSVMSSDLLLMNIWKRFEPMRSWTQRSANRSPRPLGHRLPLCSSSSSPFSSSSFPTFSSSSSSSSSHPYPSTTTTSLSTSVSPLPSQPHSRERKSILPAVMYNSRRLFSMPEDKASGDVRFIGDNIVRRQLANFCGRCERAKKRFCIPGTKTEDIEATIDTVTDRAIKDTLFVTHAGTNDVQSTKTEDLLVKYRQVIRRYREKSRHIIVPGILSRINAFAGFHSKANSINTKLRQLCDDEAVVFTSAWEHFYLYRHDGLHLNEVGSSRLGRLLNATVTATHKTASEGGAPAVPKYPNRADTKRCEKC